QGVSRGRRGGPAADKRGSGGGAETSVARGADTAPRRRRSPPRGRLSCNVSNGAKPGSFWNASILLRHPEYLGGEPRIDLGELRGDDGPQQSQGLGGGSWRNRHVGRPVELKTGVVDDLGERVAGMHAGKFEAPPARIEGEQAARRHQGGRAAGAINVVRARSRRADEIDPFDQRAQAVLEPEQDYRGHDEVEVRRAERTREAHRRVRVIADADEVDVAL